MFSTTEIFHPLSATAAPPPMMNNPFYYRPHPLCRLAMGEVTAWLERLPESDPFRRECDAGKMFGVLVAAGADGRLGYLSAFSGQVRIVGWDPKGYGHYVVVRHDNGLETVYGHMTTPLVDENMRVFTGDVLGLGGSTGRSTGPHLHFEFRYLGNAFNPEQVIDYSTGQLKCDSVYTITKAGTFGYRKSAAGVSGSGSAPKYVTIRKGDNLSAIARRNNTTVKALCRLNGIKETTIIREGRKLRVR